MSGEKMSDDTIADLEDEMGKTAQEAIDAENRHQAEASDLAKRITELEAEVRELKSRSPAIHMDRIPSLEERAALRDLLRPSEIEGALRETIAALRAQVIERRPYEAPTVETFALAPIALNMNGTVRVRLSETGLRVLDEYEAELKLPRRHRRRSVTDGNLWKGPLWQLMQEFGPSITMGMSEGPIVDNRIDYTAPI